MDSIPEETLTSKNFNFNSYLLVVGNNLDQAQATYLGQCALKRLNPIDAAKYFAMISIYASLIQVQFGAWLHASQKPDSKENIELQAFIGNKEDLYAFISENIKISDYLNVPILYERFNVKDVESTPKLINRMVMIMKAWELRHGSKDNTIKRSNPSFALQNND